MSSSSDWGGSETDSNPHSASSTPPAPLLAPVSGEAEPIPELVDGADGKATAECATASAVEPLPTTSAGGGGGGMEAGGDAQAVQTAHQATEPAGYNRDLPDSIESHAGDAAISPVPAAADGRLPGAAVPSPDGLVPAGEALNDPAAQAVGTAPTEATRPADTALDLAAAVAMPTADEREQQELAHEPEQAPGEAAPAQLSEVADPAEEGQGAAVPPAAAAESESMPEQPQEQPSEQQAEPAPPSPALEPAAVVPAAVAAAAADPSGSAGVPPALAAAAEAGSESPECDAASSTSRSMARDCQAEPVAPAVSSALGAAAGQARAAWGQHKVAEADTGEEGEDDEVAGDATTVLTVGSGGKQEQQQRPQQQLALVAACAPPLATFPVQQLQAVLGSGLSNMRHRLQAGVERESALR